LYFGVIKEQSLQLKNISKVLDNQIDLNEKQSKKINTLTKVIAQQSSILANQSKLIKQQALYIEKQSECHLQPITNGKSALLLRHNENVVLSCNSGFSDVGTEKRTCIWSQLVPSLHSQPFKCVNASRNLELIKRDALNSDIWEAYKISDKTFKYKYDDTDPVRYIRDGGDDMYDNGNIVSFSVSHNALSFVEERVEYGKLYSNIRLNTAFTTIKSHPFMALLWVGDSNQKENFTTATIKVKSNTGADGGGSYYAQQPKTYSGESSLYSAIFQVYRAHNDPSIGEVYAVISREKWNSYIDGTPTFLHGTSTEELENSFKVTGKNFLVVYFLLSDITGAKIEEISFNYFLSALVMEF